MALGCSAAAAQAQSLVLPLEAAYTPNTISPIPDLFQFEAGVGGSAYRDNGNGFWYQDGFEHRLQLTAPAFEAGMTGNVFDRNYWGLDWHFDWAWLGTIHTQAMATPSDANYNVATQSCNGKCLPLADVIGT